jgi:hypothetical protein
MEEVLECKPRLGYWLNFTPEGDEVQHRFGGTPEFAGAGCPRCQRPLLRLLSLDTRDQALELKSPEVPYLHLLYCWTCSIPFGPFSYRLSLDGSVDLLEVPERIVELEHGLEGPYDGYTGVFPLQHVSLVPQSAKQRTVLERHWKSHSDDTDSVLFEPRHQVGGHPFIYNREERSCVECHGRMPLLATICNDAAGNNPWRQDSMNTFTDNGGVQMMFFFCENCYVISAAHSCD